MRKPIGDPHFTRCLMAVALTIALATPALAQRNALNLTVEAIPSTALLTWNPIPGAAGYIIWRQAPHEDDISTLDERDVSQSAYETYKDRLLLAGRYAYQVAAVPPGGGEYLAFSDKVWVTISEDRDEEEVDEAQLTIIGPKDPKVRENSTEAVGEYTVVVAANGSVATNAVTAIEDWGEGHLFTWEDGLLAFINPPDYEHPLDRQGRNVYRVRLTATPASDDADSDYAARMLVRVTVRNVADVTVNICDRTPVVVTAITNKIRANLTARGQDEGYPGCENVTPGQMNRLRHLTLGRRHPVTALQANDFADLSNLRTLQIRSQPDLTALPTGVFDGLRNLKSLSIENTALTTLPEGLFDDLASLEVLSLNANQFATLPEGVFDGLSPTVTTIFLNRNYLEDVPADFLDGVSAALEYVSIIQEDGYAWDYYYTATSTLECHMFNLGPTAPGTRRCLVTGEGISSCVIVPAGVGPLDCREDPITDPE